MVWENNLENYHYMLVMFLHFFFNMRPLLVTDKVGMLDYMALFEFLIDYSLFLGLLLSHALDSTNGT